MMKKLTFGPLPLERMLFASLGYSECISRKNLHDCAFPFHLYEILTHHENGALPFLFSRQMFGVYQRLLELTLLLQQASIDSFFPVVKVNI